MDFSSTVSDSNIIITSLKKSVRDNAQLVFSKKVTVSLNSASEEFPEAEILDILEITKLGDASLEGLVCLIDNRASFSRELSRNRNATLSIYFPLSREKFIIKSEVKTINSLNKEEEKIDGLNPEELLKNYWSKLTHEEKLQYETVDKDSIKPHDDKADDLNKYIAQEGMEYSKNFSVAFFIPIETVYTIYPMPQVVANTRKQKFESLLKPHKMPSKFLIKFDKSDSKWKTYNLH